jgi:hypothetical protein
MTDLTLESVRAMIREELAPIRAHVDGIPLIQRAITGMQQEQRMMKAALGNVARTRFARGQVEALHSDVNAVQGRRMELATRIATLERQMKETLEKLNQR